MVQTLLLKKSECVLRKGQRLTPSDWYIGLGVPTNSRRWANINIINSPNPLYQLWNH